MASNRFRDLLRAAAGIAPLDWDSPPVRGHADGPPGPVDVVVPVYRAPEPFGRCFAALLEHTDLADHRLVVVLDGPQPAETEERLAAEARAGVEVLRNPERQGFVTSVNRGMAASARDVILFNSDAMATSGWLERLRAAAYSAPEIATVTPFSNAATICSLPRFLESNALPAGETVESFARRIEERSLCAYPRLPTGVGVCLFVKRRALDEIGPFDETAFGLGYGEESEWCMRALKAGWRHALDDATFVYHEGHRSFGGARRERVAAAHRSLAKLHPEYLATISAFIRADPLRPVRERALAGLAPERRAGGRPGGPRKVAHLVHGWPPWSPAGTELYAAWLLRHQARFREAVAYARIADPARSVGDALELLDAGCRVRLAVNNFTQRDPLSRNALREVALERDFAAFLDEERPDLLHVHHLSGHAATLTEAARRRGIPVLYQVQDWWTVCARANLLDRERRLCSGPGLAKCSRCLPLTGLPGSAVWNPLLYAERGRLLRRALETADHRVAGSAFLAESLKKLLGEKKKLDVEVIPYGVALASGLPVARIRPTALPLRLGFAGSVLPHKGLQVAAEAFSGIDPERAVFEIWGDPGVDPGFAEEVRALGGGTLVWRGRFEEAEKARMLGDLDALIVPSLGLESFGLAAREAMAMGVPVLASRRGALAELPLETERCGAFFDPERPGELRAWIERLIESPGLLDEWRRNLPQVLGFGEHAEAIEEVYERILARRRR
ncbi:MAG TPA: glycosyltransferase [Thermoanaerobaculia bacterium]|nr:glycosyltransferase [Thermoanaerobaculia bacterium]